MKIFFEWFKIVNATKSLTTNGRCMLLLENVLRSPLSDCIPELTNIEVNFVPAKTILRVRPMKVIINA